MAKKAKKTTAARPAPARVKAPKAPVERRTIQFDKAGQVITWNVPTAPYANHANHRAAFVGGVEARVQHVQANLTPEEMIVPERFADKDTQRAFEDGYHEAARQDGQSLSIRKLQAKTAAELKKAPAKKR